MSKTPTRIYAPKQDGKIIAMVRAAHPSTALRHAIRDSHTAEVATQDEIVEWLANGGKIENAQEEPKAAPVSAAVNQHNPHAEHHPVEAAREFNERRRNTREEADKYHGADTREHLVGNR